MIHLQSALRSGSGLAPREQPRQWGVSEAKTSLVPPAAKTGMADEWLPFFVGLHVWGTDFSPAFESFVGAQVSLRLLDGRCYEVLRVPVALRRSCSTHARVELSFWDMYICEDCQIDLADSCSQNLDEAWASFAGSQACEIWRISTNALGGATGSGAAALLLASPLPLLHALAEGAGLPPASDTWKEG